jgi:hypothetical protein
MRTSSLFISLLLLSACKSDSEKLLIGKWNASQLVECEELVPINTTLVNLEFRHNGTYVFNSTLNVHEEGKYRISGNYLYTHDNLKPNAPEKAVLLKAISEDSLVLQMSFKGKDQWLTLMKDGVVLAENNTLDLKSIEQRKQEMDSFYLQNGMITQNPQAVDSLPQMETGVMPTTEAGIAMAAAKAIKEAPKPEEKKVEKEPVKKFETKEESLDKQAALRKKEADKQKDEDRRRYDNYMAREKDRKLALRKMEDAKKEAERKKHEAYLERERDRKREEAQRKKKK